MARKFFYISLGILMLLAAYGTGGRVALAEWGDGEVMGVSWPWVWDANGNAWGYTSNGWQADSQLDLPVPASEVKFLSEAGSSRVVVVTHSDVVWTRLLTDVTWKNLGTPAIGPVPVQDSSFGSVKGKFR